MLIRETTETAFAGDIRSPRPVLVDFWAPWCKPCLALNPYLERLAKKYQHQLQVLKLNIDDAGQLASQHHVRGVPTFILYVDGKEYGRLSGPTSLRLDVLLGQWLADLDLDLDLAATDPDHGLSPASLSGDAASDIETAAGCAFLGAALRKRQVIDALRSHAGSMVTAPSSWLLQTGESIDSVLGVDAPFYGLLDMIYFGLRHRADDDDRHARDEVIKCIEAMAVGADLSAIGLLVLRDAVYSPAWNLERAFTAKGAGELFLEIRRLYAREAAGEAVPAREWTALQREAVTATRHGLSARSSDILEKLATPVSGWSVGWAIYFIQGVVALDPARYNAWSETEADRIQQINEQLMDQLNMPSRPMPEPGAARDKWHAEQRAAWDIWMLQARQAEPGLWQRHDAWTHYAHSLQRDISLDISERLRQAIHSKQNRLNQPKP